MNAIALILIIGFTSDAEKNDATVADFESFDQRPHMGWRLLAERGEYLQAARLIDRYLVEHNDLDASRRRILFFHSGQMNAFADQYAAAKTRFVKAIDEREQANHPIRWNTYVHATIAFLDKDFDRLKQCRDEIARGPTFQGRKANLDVVDLLIAHFDETYKQAYSDLPKPNPAK